MSKRVLLLTSAQLLLSRASLADLLTCPLPRLQRLCPELPAKTLEAFSCAVTEGQSSPGPLDPDTDMKSCLTEADQGPRKLDPSGNACKEKEYRQNEDAQPPSPESHPDEQRKGFNGFSPEEAESVDYQGGGEFSDFTEFPSLSQLDEYLEREDQKPTESDSLFHTLHGSSSGLDVWGFPENEDPDTGDHAMQTAASLTQDWCDDLRSAPREDNWKRIRPRNTLSCPSRLLPVQFGQKQSRQMYPGPRDWSEQYELHKSTKDCSPAEAEADMQNRLFDTSPTGKRSCRWQKSALSEEKDFEFHPCFDIMPEELTEQQLNTSSREEESARGRAREPDFTASTAMDRGTLSNPFKRVGTIEHPSRHFPFSKSGESSACKSLPSECPEWVIGKRSPSENLQPSKPSYAGPAPTSSSPLDTEEFKWGKRDAFPRDLRGTERVSTPDSHLYCNDEFQLPACCPLDTLGDIAEQPWRPRALSSVLSQNTSHDQGIAFPPSQSPLWDSGDPRMSSCSESDSFARGVPPSKTLQNFLHGQNPIQFGSGRFEMGEQDQAAAEFPHDQGEEGIWHVVHPHDTHWPRHLASPVAEVDGEGQSPQCETAAPSWRYDLLNLLEDPTLGPADTREQPSLQTCPGAMPGGEPVSSAGGEAAQGPGGVRPRLAPVTSQAFQASLARKGRLPRPRLLLGSRQAAVRPPAHRISIGLAQPLRRDKPQGDPQQPMEAQRQEASTGAREDQVVQQLRARQDSWVSTGTQRPPPAQQEPAERLEVLDAEYRAESASPGQPAVPGQEWQHSVSQSQTSSPPLDLDYDWQVPDIPHEVIPQSSPPIALMESQNKEASTSAGQARKRPGPTALGRQPLKQSRIVLKSVPGMKGQTVLTFAN